MKISATWDVNLKIKEVEEKVQKAYELSLKEVVVTIADAVIKGSPHVTGHNRRSIAYKTGNRVVKKGQPKGGEKPFTDTNPDLKPNEGAVYSTSGYGGYLETGTSKMDPQPYFRPALDANIDKLPKGMKAHL